MKYSEANYIIEGFDTVRNLKDTGVLPVEYHSIVDDYCKCGSENIATHNMKDIRCCDRRCPIKQPYVLLSIFRAFGGKNIGLESCKALLSRFRDSFSFNSPLSILLVPDEEVELEFADIYSDYMKIKYIFINQKMSLGELASKMGAVGFDITANDIFKHFNSPVEVKNVMKEMGGVKEFLNFFKIYDTNKIANFEILLDDVIISNYIKNNGTILRKPFKEIKVCITGEIELGSGMTRDEYINYVNYKGTASDGARVVGTVLSKHYSSYCQYVVSDLENSNNNKFKLGIMNNKLISSRDYLEDILEEVREYESAL